MWWRANTKACHSDRKKHNKKEINMKIFKKIYIKRDINENVYKKT